MNANKLSMREPMKTSNQLGTFGFAKRERSDNAWSATATRSSGEVRVSFVWCERLKETARKMDSKPRLHSVSENGTSMWPNFL